MQACVVASLKHSHCATTEREIRHRPASDLVILALDFFAVLECQRIGVAART